MQFLEANTLFMEIEIGLNAKPKPYIALSESDDLIMSTFPSQLVTTSAQVLSYVLIYSQNMNPSNSKNQNLPMCSLYALSVLPFIGMDEELSFLLSYIYFSRGMQGV